MTNDYSRTNYSPVNEPPGTTANEDVLADGLRLGLLPDQGKERLAFGDSLYPRAAEIEIPNVDDHVTGVPAWNLGANDRFGTCGPTSLSNYMTMAYWNIMADAVTVTDEAIFNLYKTCNPDFNPATGQGDRGVDMTQLLTNACDVGLEITHGNGSTEIVRPVAFGGLRTDSLDEIKATTAVLGGSVMGVSLEVAQQSQTANRVWDYQPSPAWGGHAIMGAAYSGRASGPDEEIISWQMPIGLTDAFIQNQLSQAFAVVLPIHLTHPSFLAGVDVQQLKADYEELTGRPFPGI